MRVDIADGAMVGATTGTVVIGAAAGAAEHALSKLITVRNTIRIAFLPLKVEIFFVGFVYSVMTMRRQVVGL